MTSKSFLHYWPFVRGIHLVDSPHKGPVMQKVFLCNCVIVWVSCGTCRTLIFSLLLTWPNCWTNSEVAIDLRCHHTHSNAVYGHFCHVCLSLFSDMEWSLLAWLYWMPSLEGLIRGRPVSAGKPSNFPVDCYTTPARWLVGLVRYET